MLRHYLFGTYRAPTTTIFFPFRGVVPRCAEGSSLCGVGNQLLQVDSGGTATYVYDASGLRVRKATSSAATEYFYSGNQVLAEYNPATADWVDYVYANGAPLVRATSYEDGIEIQGTNNVSGVANVFQYPDESGLQGYVIKSGDTLYLRQYQVGTANGGIYIGFSDGTTPNWIARDQDGQQINSDTFTNTWHYRKIDLSNWAGETIWGFSFLTDTNTGVGGWIVIYGDAALISSDGTVHTVYDGQTTAPPWVWSNDPSGSSGVTSSNRHLSNAGYFPLTTTNYYHADRLGSARLQSAYFGYPTWSGQLSAFWHRMQPANHREPLQIHRR